MPGSPPGAPRGERRIGAGAFFEWAMVTALAEDEMLVGADLPRLAPDTRWGFCEFARRAGDFALAMALAVYRVEDGAIVEPRLGVGGVEARPRRIPEAEAALAGRAPGPALFREAGAVGRRSGGCGLRFAHASAAYRCELAGVMVERASGGRRPMTAPREISFTVNGKSRTVRVEPRKTLADAIREDCGLTGTHLGCEHGVCGACTIILDGAPVRSCLIFAAQADGAQIRTVEGLADGDRLHPLQQAFIDHHALQCGFCTPGFLMLAVSVLEREPDIDEDGLREALSSNLCRCTGYLNILDAVEAVRSRAAPE